MTTENSTQDQTPNQTNNTQTQNQTQTAADAFKLDNMTIGEIYFDIYLSNTVPDEENVGRMRSAFAGRYATLKRETAEDLKDKNKVEKHVEKFNTISVDAGGRQSQSFIATAAMTLQGALNNDKHPQPVAIAILEVESQVRRDMFLEAAALEMLAPKPTTINKHEHNHTHNHPTTIIEAPEETRAGRALRKLRNSGAVAAWLAVAGIAGVLYQNKANSDKSDDNFKQTQSMVAKGDSTTQAMVQSGDSLTQYKADTSYNHLHKDMWNSAAKTRRAINSTHKDVDSVKTMVSTQAPRFN